MVCCVEGVSRVLESPSLLLSRLKVCAKFICGKVRSPLGCLCLWLQVLDIGPLFCV